MDTAEKLKQEQLEYYKRENELREAMIKRQRLKWKITKWAIIIVIATMLLTLGFLINTMGNAFSSEEFYNSLDTTKK